MAWIFATEARRAGKYALLITYPPGFIQLGAEIKVVEEENMSWISELNA